VSDKLDKPVAEPPATPHRATRIDTIKWFATAAVLLIIAYLIQRFMPH
jgi:hypothetical protein